MNTFNVGDEVVVIRHGCTQPYGSVGTIVQINPVRLIQATTYTIEFPNKTRSAYNEVFLQSIEVFNSPLANALREE
jgi:hypothetical protein